MGRIAPLRTLWVVITTLVASLGAQIWTVACATTVSYAYDGGGQHPAATSVAAAGSAHATATTSRRSGSSIGSPSPSELISVAAETAGGGGDLTTLYRAVGKDELKDIQGTGVYRAAPGGTEGKYFFPTGSQAENFSDLMEKAGQGSTGITSGCIPNVGAARCRFTRPLRERRTSSRVICCPYSATSLSRGP